MLIPPVHSESLLSSSLTGIVCVARLGIASIVSRAGIDSQHSPEQTLQPDPSVVNETSHGGATWRGRSNDTTLFSGVARTMFHFTPGRLVRENNYSTCIHHGNSLVVRFNFRMLSVYVVGN